MSKQINHVFRSLAACVQNEFHLVHENDYSEVYNLHFSASGLAKFTILKNETRIATLFNDRYSSLNCEYHHKIRLVPGGSLKITGMNRDTMTQDLYFGCEVGKLHSKTLLDLINEE